MKTIRTEFEDFLKAAYPNCSLIPEQYRQIEAAFYGGAACVGAIIEEAINHRGESNCASETRTALFEEMKAFIEDYKQRIRK